jgi:hypothetical protein
MAANSHNNIYNGDVSGSASSTGADSGSGLSYLIVRPEKGGIGDLYRYLVRAVMASGVAFLEGSDEGLVGAAAADHRWVILVSIIVRKILFVSLSNLPLRFSSLSLSLSSLAEDAKWPIGLLWPNGRRGDLGVLLLFNFLVWLIGNAILAEDDCR